ncbi:hypothetical protein JCM10449v2_005984 [Rhodotorula kratochvilovae]
MRDAGTDSPAAARFLSPEPMDGADTRMRTMSEEPAPIAIGSSSGSPAQPSPSSTNGAGVTRNPSIRARDAFSRLRIGSFGAAPRPAVPGGSPAPGSPTSDAGSSNSRRGSTAGAPEKPPTTAASFLSAFSPPSSVGSGGGRSPSPPLPGQPRGYAAFALPPRGNERGYRLRAHVGEREAWEYELGRELGQGGMGLVREAVRRPASEDAPMRDAGAEERDKDVKVAVKIIPRRHPHFVSLAALRDSIGAGAVEGDTHSGLVHHLHPSPSPVGGPGAGPRRASLRGAALGVDRLQDKGVGGGPLRHPSRDRAALLERSRSTSSPIRPSLGSRALSIAGVESPAPSPPAESDADEELLGSSAPGRGGYFGSRGMERIDDASDDGEGAGAGAGGDGEVDLLDLLLQREITLWRQLSHLVPAHDEAHATRWSGRGGHPHIVALLDTHRTADFDYVFMPLAEGGTLLEYVTNPNARDRDPSPASTGTRSASSKGRRSASRGRGMNGPQKPRRARGSIPIAGTASSSLSPPASTSASSASSQPGGLPLAEAGEIFLQVAEALRWMHEEAGVAHRDLKLENVVGCWETPAPRGRRRRRVWKLADFGLAEVIPDVAALPASPSSPVHGVQPLAALARAGSLTRPGGAGANGAGGGGAGGQQHALAASVGPGAPLSTAAGQGMSSSAILPSPHRTVGSPAPAAAAAANSPLSALLHPVGSLPYSSPEALRSPVPIVHPSGDIWALGCVLYALVAGRLPIWEEWELRLRVRLVKGEWDVPDELNPAYARDDDDREERTLALEVLSGCLDKDPQRRWTIRQVCESRWLARVRAREAEQRSVDAHDELVRASGDALTPLASDGGGTPASPSAGGARAPSRGRPATRSTFSYTAAGGGPPPAPSTGASEHAHTPGSASPNGPGGKGKSKSRSRTRLATRSSSRSSAYAHQFGAAGGSEEADRERRERGRSERRLRWDEERGAGTGAGARRSLSRASSSTGVDEEGGQVNVRRGRSASRPTSASARRASATGERDGREGRDGGASTPSVLETVGEPY